MANHRGTRWRGKLPISARAHPLVREFYRHLNEQQTTLSEASARSGIAYDTMSDWRYRRSPLISNFEAALNVLDLELVIRPRREPAADGRRTR